MKYISLLSSIFYGSGEFNCLSSVPYFQGFLIGLWKLESSVVSSMTMH